MEFPEFEKIVADVTAHDSTGGYAEYIATGKRQLNSFKVTLGWDSAAATHAAVKTAFAADTTSTIVAADPDAVESISFSAHITKLGRIVKQEEGYKCDVEIQPTGVPTIS
jgi:predicted secreted protein